VALEVVVPTQREVVPSLAEVVVVPHQILLVKRHLMEVHPFMVLVLVLVEAPVVAVLVVLEVLGVIILRVGAVLVVRQGRQAHHVAMVAAMAAAVQRAKTLAQAATEVCLEVEAVEAGELPTQAQAVPMAEMAGMAPSESIVGR
jgi:hypothetical protein